MAVYYKLPYKGAPLNQAKEALATLMCSRLMKLLDITHAPMQLVRANVNTPERTCWVMKSKSYRGQTERSIPLERFWELRCLPNESPLDLCMRMGWERQIADMALCDYLTATRNRDKTCFEVLCGAGDTYRLSPLMPRSLSLANAFPGDTWKIFACADVNTTNYLGATSLEQNLDLVPDDFRLPRLNAAAKKNITSGLYGLGVDDFIDASWSIIEKRWEHFESIRRI